MFIIRTYLPPSFSQKGNICFIIKSVVLALRATAVIDFLKLMLQMNLEGTWLVVKYSEPLDHHIAVSHSQNLS